MTQCTTECLAVIGYPQGARLPPTPALYLLKPGIADIPVQFDLIPSISPSPQGEHIRPLQALSLCLSLSLFH